uniref:KRR-R motif-containing protein 1 n=1 Tax=Panagrellus redivivus TaxID=6233 RepID=A0A7E4ZYT3_PANRE
MMTCRHLRRTLEDVVKKPELLVGREEEVKALRKAVAQLHGIPFHHHDDKRTLVIGGRNAAMLAKVSGEYRVIGAEGIHELVNCVVSETFTHAIVWPEQNWWLELGSASMKMAEKACRMLKFWNSFLEVSLMPPLSEDSHVTVWNKLERAYLSENSKFFRGKELLRESEVTCPRGIDVNKNGVLTDAGAGRIWRCLEKLGAVATSPQDVRVVVARRAASPKKTVSSVVTVPRPEQWSLDLVERQRDRRENRHRRPSRYERD